MGLFKGNFSFARFHVEGQLPKAFFNFVHGRIKANSFRESAKASEEKNLGWVSITDILDTGFENNDYVLGSYLIFALRVDRKIIPPALMKIKTIKEERQFLNQNNKNRLNKQIASEIKNKVKLEILSRLDPLPSFYDVCWNLNQNVVYLSSLSDKVADDFVELFKKSFSFSLNLFLPQNNPQVIQKMSEAVITQKDASLIGREFMTWLWYKSEERNGKISLPQDEEIELNFLKKIVLETGEGEYAQGVVCHGIHTELKEGKEAIRWGKKVKEAVIKLTADQNEWEFTLKADNFHYRSLKLPPAERPESKEDVSGQMLERIYLIENAANTIDRLYDYFVDLRFSPKWEDKEKKLFTKWLHQ